MKEIPLEIVFLFSAYCMKQNMKLLHLANHCSHEALWQKQTNQDVTILVGIQFALYSTIIKMCTGSIVYDSNGIKSLRCRFRVHGYFQCNAANTISKNEYVWKYKKYNGKY